MKPKLESPGIRTPWPRITRIPRGNTRRRARAAEWNNRWRAANSAYRAPRPSQRTSTGMGQEDHTRREG
jgi:hypothetical protein